MPPARPCLGTAGRRRRQLHDGLPLLLMVLMLPLARPCQAQMQSPLKGAGLPPLETTEVFVSAYLDRLLRIDEEGYVWEAVVYFYISWYDPGAYAQVAANTERMWTDPSYVCKRPCSTEADQSLCCDGVFLPSMFVKNVHGLSQDRLLYENIYPDDSASTGGASVDAQGWTSRGMKAGSVVREVRLHGSFYQPMSFQNFPFESFELLIELRLMDPTKLFTNNSMIYGTPHPGMTMQPSSAGLRLWTLGRGDDTASWRAADIRLQRFQGSMSSWFRENSVLPSHPRDPNPLMPVAQAGSAYAGGYRDASDQILGVFITVERFWKPSLINVVLPILLVFMLGMAVFVIDKSRLDIRLEVVVALFLALTTAQFTIQSHVPTSSYLVPTTQLLLATYCFLFLVSLESIFVFYVLRWRPMQELAQHRQQAARRYSQLCVESGERRGLARFSVFGNGDTRRSSVAWHASPPPRQQQPAQQAQQGQAAQQAWSAGRGEATVTVTVTPTAAAAGGGDASLGGKSLRQQYSTAAAAAAATKAAAAMPDPAAFTGAPLRDAGYPAAAEAEALPRAPLPAAASGRGAGAGVLMEPLPSPVPGSFGAAPASPATVPPSGAEAMERAWHEYLAHHLDRIAAVTLGIGYSIATILIFTLQSGYIDLFSENEAFLTATSD